jgi:hypothetical protein
MTLSKASLASGVASVGSSSGLATAELPWRCAILLVMSPSLLLVESWAHVGEAVAKVAREELGAGITSNTFPFEIERDGDFPQVLAQSMLSPSSKCSFPLRLGSSSSESLVLPLGDPWLNCSKSEPVLKQWQKGHVKSLAHMAHTNTRVETPRH